MKTVARSIVLMGPLVVSLSRAVAGVCRLRAGGRRTDSRPRRLEHRRVAASSRGLSRRSRAPPTPHGVELGVRFESETPLAIDGIRFFKGSKNTGTHVGHLWSATGTLLASATFTSESGFGWQSVRFEKPVMIEPHTVYVASYYAPDGGYSEDRTLLRNGADRKRARDRSRRRQRRLQVRDHERIPDRNLQLHQLLGGRHVLDGYHRGPAGDVHPQHVQRRHGAPRVPRRSPTRCRRGSPGPGRPEPTARSRPAR